MSNTKKALSYLRSFLSITILALLVFVALQISCISNGSEPLLKSSATATELMFFARHIFAALIILNVDKLTSLIIEHFQHCCFMDEPST